MRKNNLFNTLLILVYCLKIKDGAYVVNTDQYSDTESHWIALYALNNNVTYFDSFGAEHGPKEIEKFINRSSIATNIYRIQGYDSVMCQYFCIGFIDFILKDKSLTHFTSLFPPNNNNNKKKKK